MEVREFEFFLIEGRDVILTKYCILFLTTCYSQLVFIPVYYSCKRFSLNFSNNAWFFGSFGGKIVFFAKIESLLWTFLLFLLSFFLG